MLELSFGTAFYSRLRDWYLEDSNIFFRNAFVNGLHLRNSVGMFFFGSTIRGLWFRCWWRSFYLGSVHRSMDCNKLNLSSILHWIVKVSSIDCRKLPKMALMLGCYEKSSLCSAFRMWSVCFHITYHCCGSTFYYCRSDYPSTKNPGRMLYKLEDAYTRINVVKSTIVIDFWQSIITQTRVICMISSLNVLTQIILGILWSLLGIYLSFAGYKIRRPKPASTEYGNWNKTVWFLITYMPDMHMHGLFVGMLPRELSGFINGWNAVASDQLTDARRKSSTVMPRGSIPFLIFLCHS